MKKLDFDNLRDRAPGIILTEHCKRSAVCVPLIFDGSDDSPMLLFELRSSDMHNNPGDVCFPGGRIEDGETWLDAALRECCEELVIESEQIRTIAPLDVFCDGCLMISSVLAEIAEYKGSFNPQEVRETFTVPLKWFKENAPSLHSLELVHLKSDNFPYHLINRGEDYPFRKRCDDELFYVCQSSDGKQRVIWGITARIIKNLVDII